MKIDSLFLKNYRNYEDLEIEFNDGLNIIIGNNAQGKTNILESVYYLAITKSFLMNGEKNIINKDNDFAILKGKVTLDGKKKKLAVSINNINKKLEINNKEIKKHSDYVGILKVIIFNPDNVRLLKEGPSNRRKFLNIEISQLYHNNLILLNNFNVVLKQRNEYLKYIRSNNKCDLVYLEILNKKFVMLAVEIIKYRNDFINMINKYIDDIYFNIAGDRGLNIKYRYSVEIDSLDIMEKNMLDKLSSIKDKEIINGMSLFGPHREDFNFYLSDIDLVNYGSQGQVRMAILALKLAEVQVFKDICGSYPILLLDDIFSELDVLKRNNLIKYLNFDIQSIITTTDLNNISEDFTHKAKIFKIEDGKVINNN